MLRCPASVGLVAKTPAHLRRDTVYAQRGAALHVAMTLLIERERTLDSLVGETIGEYAITPDDVALALRPALAHVDALLDQPGAEYYLEHRVAFPTIENAFGTADLIVKIAGAANVIDHKFGAGVRVVARDDDGAVNAQLAFYAAAARHSLSGFFAGVERITLTILQPQAIEEDAELASSTEATQAELDDFVLRYRAACADALGPSPHRQRGAWCKFCPAKPICPEHTGPLLDLAQFPTPTPTASPDRGAYLQALADGLSLIDAVKDLHTALHDQAKRALLEGWVVPGYALTKGRVNRAWSDEQAAIATLLRLGLERADLIDDQLRSPKQVELRAKARDLKISSRIDRFAPVRRLAVPGRKRARPGARTGRDRAMLHPGARSLPRRRHVMTNHDSENNHGHDPDNPIAPAASAGAMISLEALGAVLNTVDTATIAGRSGLPMLQFKREGDGTWSHGQRRTVVEDGARWAVNPMTFRRGFICFVDKKVVGERLLPVSQPMLDPSELPDHGFPWVQQWAVNLKCLDGADAGVEVIYKPTTVGGVQAIVGLVEEVRDRLNGGVHGGKVSPVVQLGKYDYSSTQYGRIWAPLLDVDHLDVARRPSAGAVPRRVGPTPVVAGIRGGG